ncbi:MAG: ABC transporter substrate-binding protein [Prevotellaceae bacterium]|jgi:ABC-type branched-subunit amino acid transport system substrate-binding protein|nr:ABC transporter substrate-binding protein [Prevotellaceae bacterium]
MKKNLFKISLFLLFAVFSAAFAQSSPCEKMTIDGKQYYLYVSNSRETLADISRKFNVSENEILESNYLLARRGRRKVESIKIPVKEGSNPCESAMAVEQPQQAAPNEQEVQQPAYGKKTLKVAYLMPFALNETQPNPGNDRFMEFYQGSLLAIEDLKNEGVSFEIHAYDTGMDTALLGHILTKPELKEMDIFIGPVYTSQMKKVSDYTKKFGITHVVPFSAQTAETMSNPVLFQCNTSSAHQTEIAARRFARNFNDRPVLIVEFQDVQEISNKTGELVAALKRELQYNNVPFQAVIYSDQNLPTITQAMADDGENIVVLGTTDAVALTGIISQLKASSKDFALFGMPDWQTDSAVQEQVFSCKLYLFTPFYIDDLAADVMRFRQNFVDAFGAYNQSSMPFFNFYGYDVSFYFLSALARYGNDFVRNLPSLQVSTLQSTFKFERGYSQGGFINNGLFLLKYTPDEPVEKRPF